MKLLRVLGFSLFSLFVVGVVIYVFCLTLMTKQEKYDTYSLPADVISLDQNWQDDVRQQMHFSSFGSKLMPYSLFTNLELSDSSELLSSPEQMSRLGFIAQLPATNNPSGLPIGFARYSDDVVQDWVGLTCAACHTNMVTYNGAKIVVDGGPGVLDFLSFEHIISDALDETLERQVKFDRLVERLKLDSEEDKRVLRLGLEERAEFFNKRISVNHVDVNYGHGRLDAFGRIFNAVTATAMNMPENKREPNAPVSIPMLWDAQHLDVVQWNGSAPNINPGPLVQNATTVLAVYGEIDMERKTLGYSSSIDTVNLGYIQSQYIGLTSPTWPEDIFGEIDHDKANKGADIYKQQCVSCHELIDRTDKHRKLKATLINIDEIGTDPVMAENFATRKSHTGHLEGKRMGIVAGARFTAEVPTIELVLNATIGTMLYKPLETISAFIAEANSVYKAPFELDRKAYKARSLNGIWATAPFLHNGSVPTLYDLLQKVEQRPITFYVGNTEMEPNKVGFVHSEKEFTSSFDTRLYGNKNSGHLFGTDLSETDKWALIEYLKTL